MKIHWRNEQGVSLIELVVLIIIIGIALPSLLSIIGVMANSHTKNEIMLQCVNLADSKMEEIVAFKQQQWDWYKSINGFIGSETLPDGYIRTITVEQINQWGNAAIDAYEVSVKVTHLQLPDGYTLTVRFTKYH